MQFQAPVAVFSRKDARFGGGIDQFDQLHMATHRVAQAGAGIQRQVEAVEVGRLVIADRPQAEIRIASHLDAAQPEGTHGGHRQAQFAVLHHRRVDADAGQYRQWIDAVLLAQGGGDAAHDGRQGGLQDGGRTGGIGGFHARVIVGML
ncbi:hypothetical protein D3C81_1836620 [compost metagenome]